MIIGLKDILTLDDKNDYLVVSKINYENKTYYYLVDINNNENLKFCYEENSELIEIEDKELTTKLLPMFLKVSKEELSNN